MRKFTDEELLEIAHRDNAILDVAHGWVGLRLYDEAVEEISGASAFAKTRADFLEVHAFLYSEREQWQEELECADAMISDDPNFEFGYGFRAEAIFHLNGAWAAYEDLAKAVEKFPSSPLMKFNLACYACVAGKLFSARRNLVKMFQLAENADDVIFFQNLAQTGEDLKPLGSEIFRAKEIASKLNQTKLKNSSNESGLPKNLGARHP